MKTILLKPDELDTSIVETCRKSVRKEAVERYANALINADKTWIFPPLLVWQTEGKNYLIDGHHRTIASVQVGLLHVVVKLQDFANLAEAKRFALCANSTHGERLTREELRENINAYLMEGGAIDSDTVIATKFGVGRDLVNSIRTGVDGMTKKEKTQMKVAQTLAENPDATITEVAETAEISRNTARKVMRLIADKKVKDTKGVLTDCFGREIPQAHIEHFMQIKSALKYASSCVNDIAHAITRMQEIGAFAQTSELEQVLSALEQIRYVFRTRKPDALCTCRGDGCRRCGNVGFLEKNTFNVLIPQDEK